MKLTLAQKELLRTRMHWLPNSRIGLGIIQYSDVYKWEYPFPTYWIAVEHANGDEYSQSSTAFIQHANSLPDKFQKIITVPSSYGARVLHLYRKTPVPVKDGESIIYPDLTDAGRYKACDCCGLSHTNLRAVISSPATQLFMMANPSRIVCDYLSHHAAHIIELDGIIIAGKVRTDTTKITPITEHKHPFHKHLPRVPVPYDLTYVDDAAKVTAVVESQWTKYMES